MYASLSMHKGSVSVRNSELFDQTVHKVVLSEMAFRFVSSF